MKHKSKIEPEHTCQNCWEKDGTQRESRGKVFARVCRKSGLFVVVTGPEVGSCQRWRERPSDAAIARRANQRAGVNRISEITKRCLEETSLVRRQKSARWGWDCGRSRASGPR